MATVSVLFHLIALLVACCLATERQATEIQCFSPEDKNLKFVLTSSRNRTGHWNAQILLEHGHDNVSQKAPYEVQMLHNLKLCTEVPAEHPPLSSEEYSYFAHVGSSYKLYSVHDSWHNAKATCEEDGAHLAIINSKEEAMVMLEVFGINIGAHAEEYLDDQAFLGVHDITDEGKFVTIFGDPLSSTGYVKWAPSEPNNNKNAEDCVSLRRNGRLNDVPCMRPLSFFCEKEL